MAIDSPASPSKPTVPPVTISGTRAASWERFDAKLEWLSEQLNPIVVKEARQALKSKQFTITFGLLLVFGACWTALGVAMQMPGVFYTASGPTLVVGYYVILAVPLMVIVPFAAFRSLAAEREDGTFELLSIATLSSRQVVLGKLASAVLQMLVYYSAIAPCIAFTYLLRGLDIITIGLMLAYLFLASTLLSAFGLALATVTKERHWQVLLSVLLVAGLVLAFWGWLIAMMNLFSRFLTQAPFDQPGFWMFNIALVMFHVTFVVLFVFLAAGQISFASDNRSTAVRWVLFVQHVFWLGWMAYGIVQGAAEFFEGGATVALVYWWIVGACLIGEKAELSPRVRRQLPQTFVGRTLLTWFNPGSGTGYFFTLLNYGMLLFTMAAAVGLTEWFSGRANGRLTLLEMFYCGAAMFFLLAAYLGVGRLIVLAMRSYVPNGVVFSLLLQIVLVTFGTLTPIVVQLSLFGRANMDYTALQITNPFWTLMEIFEGRGTTSTDVRLVWILLLIASVIIVLVHFFWTIREVTQTRLLAPQRVMEEDAAVVAARTPVKRKNPWDEPAR